MRRFLVLVLGLLGCETLTAPDAIPFTPPPVYHQWWADMAVCAKVDAPLSRVQWFASETCFDPGDGHCHHGLWLKPHDIYLDGQLLDIRWLVQHEMLHDLLQTGDHDHPVFQRCDPSR